MDDATRIKLEALLVDKERELSDLRERERCGYPTECCREALAGIAYDIRALAKPDDDRSDELVSRLMKQANEADQKLTEALGLLEMARESLCAAWHTSAKETRDAISAWLKGTDDD